MTMGERLRSAGGGALFLTALSCVSQLLGFASALVAAGFLIYHLFFRRHKPEELYVNRVRAAKEAARAERKEDKKEEDEHGGDGH